MSSDSSVTTLLQQWRAGDSAALEQLTPLVYDDLRKIAAHHLRTERPEHTLQATALVNAAFAQLVESGSAIEDRAHFLAIAARVMRHILTDYGRARRRAKRGGGVKPVPLDEQQVGVAEQADIVDLDEALDHLARFDERKADVVVLHYFGGLTYEETATALSVSPATVDRDLRLAKAWLATELGNA